MILFKTTGAVLLAALIVAGCGEIVVANSEPATAANAAGGFPVTIATAGGEIEIPALPTKIVSMSATHTEMLFAIGAGDQIVAVDAFSNYPADAPVTDLTGFAPNVEAIVGYETDLVVTDGDWDGASMEALTDLGIPVLILPAALTLDDVYAQLEQLGVATGQISDAAALVAEMQSEVTAILDSVPNGGLTFYHELDTTFYSVTSGTFIGHVYELMGLDNIADAVGEGSFGYPQLSEEYILQQDPDLILLADTICCDVTGDTLKDRPGWDTLTAVQNGMVVELNDDIASRWGPRIVDHMEIVADAIAQHEMVDG